LMPKSFAWNSFSRTTSSRGRRLDETPPLGGVEIFPAAGWSLEAHSAGECSGIGASPDTEWPILFHASRINLTNAVRLGVLRDD
jgi:hypothetical protein